MIQNVATFYRFVDLHDIAGLRGELETQAARLNIKGTILLAPEGINGTLTGAREALTQFSTWLQSKPEFVGMPFEFSSAHADNPVFYRLKVRIKAEIVALGQPDVKPARRTGVHVDAQTFNELLDDPDVVILDTRNHYEIEIGTFPGSADPHTRSFKQFPRYVAEHLDTERNPRVAMFCTGGIRCEKASAYLLEQGFSEVYQLEGGILQYLDTVNPEDNRWQGECFVFDQRVSVDERLIEGSFQQCFACRRALSKQDLASNHYVRGVSCPYCVDEQAPEQTEAFKERQKQVELAAARGERHIGNRQ